MKKINTIIFDYGGTLDTDARHWAHVLFEGYRHAQIPVDEPDFRDAYVYGERALAKNGKRTSRPLPTIATPTWSEIWK